MGLLLGSAIALLAEPEPRALASRGMRHGRWFHLQAQRLSFT